MIELRGVTKRFGSVTAVDDVTLAVTAGEFLTLLGPSGCGKTTLLRLIAGFETPDAGRILLNGADVTALPPYRRNVNQVFQSYALFPHLNVRDNVGFGLKMQKVAKAERQRRIAEAIETVSLAGLELRKPDELSGGQRQRVALARALVCRPQVLLLDEPLSALDAKLRQAVQIELKHLQRRLGLTFVFVTHDQQEALTMSDRIAIVNAGRIEQLGSPGEIYNHPRTAFAADFVGQANLKAAAVVARNGAAAQLRLEGGLELTLPPDAVPAGKDAVLVSIRPEKIRLGEGRDPADNPFEAKLEERIFQGATQRLSLLTPSGTRLLALATSEGAEQAAPRPGDTLHCAIRPADILVVG